MEEFRMCVFSKHSKDSKDYLILFKFIMQTLHVSASASPNLASEFKSLRPSNYFQAGSSSQKSWTTVSRFRFKILDSNVSRTVASDSNFEVK